MIDNNDVMMHKNALPSYGVVYNDGDIVIVDNVLQLSGLQLPNIDMCIIVFVTKGSIRLREGTREMEFGTRNMAIIPPNCKLLDIWTSPDMEFKAVAISNRMLLHYLREKLVVWVDNMFVRRQRSFVLDEERMKFCLEFYHMLMLSLEMMSGNRYCGEILHIMVNAAILGITSIMEDMSDGTETGQIAIPAGKALLYRFLYLLGNSNPKYRPVKAYAADLCVTPKYLTEMCRRYSGNPASYWIRGYVKEDILYYLRQTDYPVKEISDRIGFPNPSFFCHYVKEQFGRTPVSMRNKR